MIIHTDTSDYEDLPVFLILEKIGSQNHTTKDMLSKDLTCKCTVHVGQATSFIRLPDPSLKPVRIIAIIVSNHKIPETIYHKHKYIRYEKLPDEDLRFLSISSCIKHIRHQKTIIYFAQDINSTCKSLNLIKNQGRLAHL
jgi:hypothetical protein